MKRNKMWAIGLAGCFLMQCVSAVASEQDTQEAFNAYLDKLYVEWVSENPFQIHYSLEHPEDYGIELTSYTLLDYSEYDDEAIAEYEKKQEEEVQTLKSFNKDELTESQQILYDKILDQIDLNEKYTDMLDFTSLIGGASGVVNTLANNFQNYLFIEKKDIEDYLKFLEDIPNYIDYVIQYTNEYADYGITPSNYMLKVNLEAIEDLISGDTNVFVEGFEEKIAEASYLSDEEKTEFQSQNSELVETVVNPAFEKLKAQLTEWESTLDEWEGFGAYTEGEDYYNYLIETYAGVSMDGEELFDYMSDKMDEITDRFVELLDDDSIYDKYLNSDYGFEERTPSEILDDLRVYTKEHFPEFNDPSYQVEELPKALRSDSVLAYYLVPQDDYDVINQICLNPDTLGSDLGQLYLTLAHEGYPGHLYATNYMKQNRIHPISSYLSNTGFDEGWAEYASHLSLDSWGLDEKLMEVLFLEEEMNYLLTGLTDIGINYGAWSLDDVYDLWNEYYTLDSAEDVRDVYDGCIAEPGVILSYSVGYFQICDLEDEVKALQGDAFDHNEFVKELLSVGSGSFDLIREYVINWANEV